jgi:hypothetical protein
MMTSPGKAAHSLAKNKMSPLEKVLTALATNLKRSLFRGCPNHEVLASSLSPGQRLNFLCFERPTEDTQFIDRAVEVGFAE